MRIDNGTSNPERVDRAWRIAQRYLSNIRKTRGWQNTNSRAESMDNIDAAMNEIRKMNTKQYSRSTYMSGNAG